MLPFFNTLDAMCHLSTTTSTSSLLPDETTVKQQLSTAQLHKLWYSLSIALVGPKMAQCTRVLARKKEEFEIKAYLWFIKDILPQKEGPPSFPLRLDPCACKLMS